MTPLEAAREALDQFRALPAATPVDVEAIGAISTALDRTAQLEKVAELARTSVRGPDPQAAEEATLLLDLALTALDHPGATPGPLTAEQTARAAWPSWRDQRGTGEGVDRG